MLHKDTLTCVKKERISLRDKYFPSYIISIILHILWIKPNIPIPPGIRDRVVQVLREKIAAGLYESS